MGHLFGRQKVLLSPPFLFCAHIHCSLPGFTAVLALNIAFTFLTVSRQFITFLHNTGWLVFPVDKNLIVHRNISILIGLFTLVCP
jgi:hypothetical protein